MDYIQFLSKYGYSQELVNIAKGLVDVPSYTVQAPSDLSFGFPPVLIPLWSNASWPGYIGITKNWFGNRQDTFVQFYADEFSFVEIARNFDQLKAWMVFDFLCNVPNPDEVGRFAESIGFCDADEVESIFADCEDVSDLAALNVFEDDLPPIIEKGDEFGVPEWLMKTSGVNEIKRLISTEQYEDAWCQLNSAVISKPDVVDILELLSHHVPEKDAFKDLITCWLASNL
ncbi:hypothetical protein [Photobacterium atrarenae]|uniref:Uncharacterized protein n=1 Tax=Photobacterium atrarenae TaxID=865757 RepID=A0ABY5GBB3_9GAMM|nr:hypothetical protein [Photobacterium atrarenae]UTV26468.1 hypothetical protein NNL38_08750 [Photobacterium atrarenae]